MINVIATDLDGTLLDDSHQMNEQLFTRVLNSLERKNGQLIIASGEQLDWCENRFAKWANDLFFVAANGAVVANKSGQILSKKEFTVDDLLSAKNALNQLNINQFVIGKVRGGLISNNAPTRFKQIMRFYYPDLRTFSDWQTINTPIVKIAVAVEEGRERHTMKMINNHLDDGLHAIVGGNGELDIIKSGTSKANGVKTILKYLGRSSDNLLVFGDQLNDVPLFKLAKEACAVKNAVPEIKQLATKIIDSNNDNGVLIELKNRFC